MALRSHDFDPSGSTPTLSERFEQVRRNTVELIAGLSDADCTVQSMSDASPAKWHLAHTSWFWEEFLLCGALGQTDRFNADYAFLFNSYYDAVGDRHERSARGCLSRPSLDEVLAFRQHVDESVLRAFDTGRLDEPEIKKLIELGLAHEEQHQELLLTDILHLFSLNPLKPAYNTVIAADENAVSTGSMRWTRFPDGGIHRIGHKGSGFAFDCEGPAHDQLIRPFEIANRAVTNRDWLSFMEDGGYETPSLWLSEGWAQVQSRGWTAPLYWEHSDLGWQSLTLFGMQPLALDAPVCQISFFEADAYASWAGARLPREEEWEVAAHTVEPVGNDRGSGFLRPKPQDNHGLSGMFGDVWEWTASPFTPYPGFQPAEGAVGEYNGKFMSGQYVLRGGSCVTPPHHLRPTYRNFFQPEKRWQFSGLRLARDL